MSVLCVVIKRAAKDRTGIRDFAVGQVRLGGTITVFMWSIYGAPKILPQTGKFFVPGALWTRFIIHLEP